MRPTLFFTVGLPGSGKSTAAHALVAASNGTTAEVSKDDLRLLPDAPASHARRERWVVARRDERIAEALSSGRSIVVHDTNFNPCHAARFAELAAEFDARLECLDFTHVDVHECIRRDAQRAAPVGESVIWGMYRRYVRVPSAG